jgi:type I restriction enzyme M protein
MSENSTQVQTKPKKIKIKKIAKINSKKENEDYSVLINNSDSYLDDINQYCHNKGILFGKRINIILSVLRKEKNNEIDNKTYKFIQDKLIKNIYSNEELIQKIFMFYGDKVLKKNFDQFYTPLSIGKFMCELCNKNKSVIDPACGTGDLVVYYKENSLITLWDVSNDVIELTKINYNFQNMDANIDNLDSIKYHEKNNGNYDYVFLNPPFGSKTIIQNRDILKNYELGKNEKKQEIGILFIERSINLLKEGGVAFLIVPSGYLGNSNNNAINLRKYLLKYRIISILRLPSNSFSRSGTGVSTYLIIINKNIQSLDYDIHIKDIENIGYILNKKNTPLKYKKKNGDYILNRDNYPIIDNDFDYIKNEIYKFCFKNNLDCLKQKDSDCVFETVNTKNIKDNNYVLDIGRYLKIYKECTIKFCNKVKINELIDNECDFKFKKNSKGEYIYLDIKEVSTPFYNGKKMCGHELPGRASYLLKKNDILVSKLKGKISFTIILNDQKNLVCTNGFVVLRPQNEKSLITIFANLFTNEFKIQHNYLATGSIMETISEDEIKNITLNKDIDEAKYDNIIKSMRIIKNELN